MKHLKLFEELQFDFVLKDDVYHFTDSENNQYRVYFSPLSDRQVSNLKLSRKVTYELEFLSEENDYLAMTGANKAFSVSNFIFGDILKDFVERHPSCERIIISSLDYKRKNLYLRSLRRTLEVIDFEIEYEDFPEENDLVLCRTFVKPTEASF